MTSIRLKFRPSAVPGREGTLYYRISRGRCARHIPSGLHILTSEWNERHAALAGRPAPSRREYISHAREKIRHDLQRLAVIERRIALRDTSYTADDIVDEYRRYCHDYSLFNFMEGIIGNFRNHGHARTSETYATALSSFRAFRRGNDILLDTITPALMEDYEAWLRGRGLTANSVGFYTRILRATYNRGLEEAAFDDRQPFSRVYTGVDKTVKRALSLNTLRRIMRLRLGGDRMLEYARDMFMISFYMRGMSFVDMAFLRKKDLTGGVLTYRRRKTGQLMSIGWTKEMQGILDRYPENKTEYLLPIITRCGTDGRTVYRNKSYSINRSLKKIGEMAGVDIPLTLYVARHSWASAARAKGVPVSVISEGMGHDSETTTRIYLAQLETSVVDRANAMILKSLH